MKDLVSKILTVRQELDDLKRQRNALTNQISKKQEYLESLEILTVNQIDMFEDG